MLLALVAALALAGLMAVNAQSDLNSPQAFLTPHNAARSAVGVGPLAWNTTLATYARNYGSTRLNRCTPLVHSTGPYGENLYWGYNTAMPPSAKDAVASWVGEKKDYNYQTNSCNPGKVCGHYTQVVWKATTQVGCATLTCNDQYKSSYIICSYSPPGNYVGQKPY